MVIPSHYDACSGAVTRPYRPIVRLANMEGSTNQGTWLGEALNQFCRWSIRAYWGLVIVIFLAGLFTVYTYTWATMTGHVWDLQIYPEAGTGKGK